MAQRVRAHAHPADAEALPGHAHELPESVRDQWYSGRQYEQGLVGVADGLGPPVLHRAGSRTVDGWLRAPRADGATDQAERVAGSADGARLGGGSAAAPMVPTQTDARGGGKDVRARPPTLMAPMLDLLLVRLPWVAVMVLLWLVYRDRYVPDARTLDMFTASGWIGPAFVGSLVMFLVGTVLLVPRLL